MTQSRGFWLAIAIVSGGLIYLLAPVLTPFLIAALLAYVADPMVDRLEARKLSRTAGVSIVFTVLTSVALLLVVIMVPLLQKQIIQFATNLPGYIDSLQRLLVPWLQQQFDIDIKLLDVQAIKESLQSHARQAGTLAMTVMGSVTRSGLAVLEFMANMVLIPVVTFYLLRDWDIFVGRIRELIPRSIEPVISKLSRQSDEVLGAFLRGQILVMLALGTLYSIGLWIAGIQYALLIGLIAGIVSFVPYLGLIIGLLLAGTAAIFQYQDVTHLVYVGIVFGIGQLLESVLLTPLLVGDRIGLHPVAVIFAVLAFGQLFGFVGVLLALPVAAVVAVIMRYLHEQYMRSKIYSSAASTTDT